MRGRGVSAGREGRKHKCALRRAALERERAMPGHAPASAAPAWLSAAARVTTAAGRVAKRFSSALRACRRAARRR